ncbi:MAG: 4-hydroxyphenylpyruvate dioxygenase [Legionellaceae bacterium]|nr:4-hydroxyphenylpyruvate dioxygenase [Legionellaceae bacterium]
MEDIDYIEFYVGDLAETVHFYKTTFNFTPIAYLNHEDRSSILIQHGSIRFVLTTSSDPNSRISNFIHTHGDGVKDIAFLTHDIKSCLASAIQNGNHVISNLSTHGEGSEQIITATIGVFGDMTHTFIQRASTHSQKLPHFIPMHHQPMTTHATFTQIDHLAICVYSKDFSSWIRYYQDAYQFDILHQEYLMTPKSGMNSCALISKNKRIKLVFVTPIHATQPSQITTFLNAFQGPGIQHIAFLTQHIVSAVHALHETELDFLPIPKTYYKLQKNKFIECTYDFELLQKYAILMDKTNDGFLYQIFSKPISQRATLFFEIIERAGCAGFGSNNIKTLFQAIEREELKHEPATV